jgi:hypothetical protein
MTDTITPGSVPPYIAFGTLLNQLERMEREGVPSRIDNHYLAGMAGGTRSQFKVCLRSLGLIEDDNRTTGTLAQLAKNPDRRPELLAGVLRGQFPDLAALNGNATRGELEEVMTAHGLTNADTRRKAIGFYLAAADYAGIPLSPFLRPAKRTGSSTAPRRPRPARKQAPAAPPAPSAPSQGNAHAVQLKSGGQVALSVSVNVMELSVDDREFIFGLIDKLRAYESGTPAATVAAGSSPSGVGL